MSEILTPEDLVNRYPSTTKQSWAYLRYCGRSPKFFKVGRKVFYREEDVIAWEQENLQSSTAEAS